MAKIKVVEEWVVAQGFRLGKQEVENRVLSTFERMHLSMSERLLIEAFLTEALPPFWDDHLRDHVESVCFVEE